MALITIGTNAPIEIDDFTLSYPLQLAGAESAYSTDFEVPFTHPYTQALNITAPWDINGQGEPVEGICQLGENIMTCSVTPTSVKERKITCSLKINILPEIFNKRICDITKELGTDWYFKFYKNNDQYTNDDSHLYYFPYYNGLSVGYDYFGGGSGQYLPQWHLPSVSMWPFLTDILGYYGITYDMTDAPFLNSNGFNLTLDSIRLSLIIDKLVQSNGYIGDSAYVESIDFNGVVGYGATKVAFKTLFDGEINITSRFYTGSNCVLTVERAGTTVISMNYTASFTQLIAIQKGDTVTLRLTALADPSYAYFENLFEFQNVTNFDTKRVGEKYDTTRAYIDGSLPTLYGAYMVESGFLSCLTLTLGELLQDFATMGGATVIYHNGVVHFNETGTYENIDVANLLSYEFGTDLIGRHTRIKYANFNEETGEGFDTVREYPNKNLQETKYIYEMQGVKAGAYDKQLTDGNTYTFASVPQWENGKFQNHETFFFSSNPFNPFDRCAPFDITRAPLPTAQQNIIVAEYETPRNVNNNIFYNIGGRDYVILERETDNNGITTFKAILMG